MKMEDFKQVNDPKKLQSYLEYTIKAYQSLGEKFLEQNEAMVTMCAHVETNRQDVLDKDAHIKRLNMEIINLYRELGETKYNMSINIDELVLDESPQLCFEFVEFYNMK